MKTFKQVNKVYIKSNNTTNKIFNRYLFCLIPYILLIIIYNLIWGEIQNIINLLLSTIISLLLASIIQVISNIIKKEKNNIQKILFDDKVLIISLMIGLLSSNSGIIAPIISIIVTMIIKNLQKKVTISSVLYGALVVILINYFNNIDTPLINLSKLSYINNFDNILKPYGNILTYLIGTKYYLSPILSIIAFIYLFYKKSIKYNIVVSYLLMIIITMLTFGLFNNMNIWYLFFQLTTGNILFLIVFLGTDYSNTPTTGEGQFIYGMILGIITSILRFIIPELSVVLTLIIGPLLLTKFINRISFKLRYNKKYYYTLLTINIIILLITNILINIII